MIGDCSLKGYVSPGTIWKRPKVLPHYRTLTLSREYLFITIFFLAALLAKHGIASGPAAIRATVSKKAHWSVKQAPPPPLAPLEEEGHMEEIEDRVEMVSSPYPLFSKLGSPFEGVCDYLSPFFFSLSSLFLPCLQSLAASYFYLTSFTTVISRRHVTLPGCWVFG